MCARPGFAHWLVFVFVQQIDESVAVFIHTKLIVVLTIVYLVLVLIYVVVMRTLKLLGHMVVADEFGGDVALVEGADLDGDGGILSAEKVLCLVDRDFETASQRWARAVRDVLLVVLLWAQEGCRRF